MKYAEGGVYNYCFKLPMGCLLNVKEGGSRETMSFLVQFIDAPNLSFSKLREVANSRRKKNHDYRARSIIMLWSRHLLRDIQNKNRVVLLVRARLNIRCHFK